MEAELQIQRQKSSNALHSFLRSQLQKIIDLRVSDLSKTLRYPVNLFGLIYPWIAQSTVGDYDSDAEKTTISAAGFDGNEVSAAMAELLRTDEHLRRCCLNEVLLSKCFDLFFERTLERTENQVPSDADFDEYFEKYLDVLYFRPFESISFSHLFNFETDEDNLSFGTFDLMRINGLRLARILGTYPPSPFPHPFSSGEHFIVFRETALIEDDGRWLLNKWEQAEDIARVFQYYKDGVIHVNYTIQHFQPDWVNLIRKTSFFPVGELRRIPYREGKSPYKLSEAELEEVANWVSLFQLPAITNLFSDNRNKLGNAIEAAGTYYESSHTQIESVRCLIDLAIALEAIFSPYNQNEISFQLSQLAAQFVGQTAKEKREIFDQVRALYKRRSTLFHGSYDAHKDTFVSFEELERWSSIIRRAIVGFISLYIRGSDDHKKIVTEIRESLLDPKIRRRLRKQSNLRMLISEYESGKFVL